MKKQSATVQLSKQERTLFCVMGWKPGERATALIVAATESDAEYYALRELGFVSITKTNLVSDAVYVGAADTKV